MHYLKMNTRMYHVIVRNMKTGKKIYMTQKPVTHKEGCTILSKLTKHRGRYEMLEEVTE